MKATRKEEITIYLDFINIRGEVTESHPVAVFHNQNWADIFLRNYNYNDKISRIRQEVKA